MQSVIKWTKNNPDKVKIIERKSKEKRYSNPKNKISICISSRIRCSLKGNKKENKSWEILVGYNLRQLMTHLENLFKEGMSWDNHGTWHIDHIIPISLWEFSNYEDREFKQCWALCNLQPLWAKDNLSKRNKILI